MARARVLLPAPFDAQDGQNAARSDADRDAEQRLRRPVANVEVVDLEQGLRHLPALPADSGVPGPAGAAVARCAGSLSPR